MGFGSSRVCKRYAVIRHSFLNFSLLVHEFFSYLFFIMFGFEFVQKKISLVFDCFYRMVFLFIAWTPITTCGHHHGAGLSRTWLTQAAISRHTIKHSQEQHEPRAGLTPP